MIEFIIIIMYNCIYNNNSKICLLSQPEQFDFFSLIILM